MKPPPNLRFTQKEVEEATKRINLIREELFLEKLKSERIITKDIPSRYLKLREQE